MRSLIKNTTALSLIYNSSWLLFEKSFQIINALIGGPIVKYVYGGNPIFALIISGVSLLIAAVLVTKVKDVDDTVIIANN